MRAAHVLESEWFWARIAEVFLVCYTDRRLPNSLQVGPNSRSSIELLKQPSFLSWLCLVWEWLGQVFVSGSFPNDKKKKRRPNNNYTRDLSRHFSKEDLQSANTHMKRCSTSLVIREMPVRTTARYHFIPTRTAIRRWKLASAGEDVRILVCCWWECKMVQCLWTPIW